MNPYHLYFFENQFLLLNEKLKNFFIFFYYQLLFHKDLKTLLNYQFQLLLNLQKINLFLLVLKFYFPHQTNPLIFQDKFHKLIEWSKNDLYLFYHLIFQQFFYLKILTINFYYFIQNYSLETKHQFQEQFKWIIHPKKIH